ncbi:MAG: flagellar hook-basal body protein [Longimicrobiales bacterium]
MNGPLRAGAEALRYWEARQATLSNNLANVSTPGFKGERVFARLLDDASLVAEGSPDLTAGGLSQTERPLDVALAGDGFLVVETERGERWIRGGSFSLDAAGLMVDSAGNPVLGESGPIVLPPGPVEIAPDGVIRVGGADVDRFRLERTGDPGALVREGANHWMPAADATPVALEQALVQQGHLEDSNVDPVGAMVEMIEIQRAYQAVQRTMQTADGVMETITTQIGRVG